MILHDFLFEFKIYPVDFPIFGIAWSRFIDFCDSDRQVFVFRIYVYKVNLNFDFSWSKTK